MENGPGWNHPFNDLRFEFVEGNKDDFIGLALEGFKVNENWNKKWCCCETPLSLTDYFNRVHGHKIECNMPDIFVGMNVSSSCSNPRMSPNIIDVKCVNHTERRPDWMATLSKRNPSASPPTGDYEYPNNSIIEPITLNPDVTHPLKYLGHFKCNYHWGEWGEWVAWVEFVEWWNL